LGGIWDYREDEEGIYYDIKNSDPERQEKFKKRKGFILQEMWNRSEKRVEKLGFNVEEL
jgi:hypothetical protein